MQASVLLLDSAEAAIGITDETANLESAAHFRRTCAIEVAFNSRSGGYAIIYLTAAFKGIAIYLAENLILPGYLASSFSLPGVVRFCPAAKVKSPSSCLSAK